MNRRTAFTGEELAQAVGIAAGVTAEELFSPMFNIFMEAHGRGRVTLEDLTQVCEMLEDAGSRCGQRIGEQLTQAIPPTDPPSTGHRDIDEILVEAQKQMDAQFSEIWDRTRDAVDLQNKLPPAQEQRGRLP